MRRSLLLLVIVALVASFAGACDDDKPVRPTNFNADGTPREPTKYGPARAIPPPPKF